MQAFTDAMALIGSLVGMVLIIALTWFATRWYAGKMGRGISGRHIKIIDKTSLGPGQMLLIIQAGEKYYLIGSGEKNVQLICELPGFDPDTGDLPQPAPSFPQIFRDFVSKAAKGGSPKNGGGLE